MSKNKPDKKNGVEQLIRHHQSGLKSFIRKRVASDEDAEDLLHDVFYQLTKAMEDKHNPIVRVTSWLYQVARNLIINKYKKKREEAWPETHYNEEGDVLEEFSEILFNEDVHTPETEYIRSLVWDELELALSELPDEQREVFELTTLDGMPVKEVAEVTDTPVNTVLSRKHYAIKHLRNRLKDLYEDFLSYG